jgi:hypothetical protein
MRKKSVLSKTLGMLAALGLLAGCASKPASPAAQIQPAVKPAAEIIATPPARVPDTDTILANAAAKPPAPFEGEGWKPLFDGQTLTGWKVTEFGGHGPADCEPGRILLGMGAALTGINWTNDLPSLDYEVALDAMRVQGSDFFCGLTFPVGESHCSLILGGWGGALVGLSSIDGQDASENETTQYIKFETGQWYRVRVRVTPAKIEAWLDNKQIVNLATARHKISLRYGEIELSKPLGLATWQTTAALREIKMRRLEAAASTVK